MGSLSSILQRDRILSSFSMGMQKAMEGQAEKGLMLPFPLLPPPFSMSVLCLLGMCKEKERHQRRSPLNSDVVANAAAPAAK